MIPAARLVTGPFRSLWNWVCTRPASFAVGSLAALGVGAFIWFVVWMATPRHVNVEVDSISWMHITHLRQREVRHKAGWYRQSNKGFYNEPVFNQTCERRFHYTETYVCGSYQVSCGSSCSTTVYVYCNRDVYDDWCSYDYYEWPVKDTQQLLGFTHETSWGTFTLEGSYQRLQHIASYEVNFKSEDDSFQYKPDSLDDFKRFFKGDRWQLTVGRIRRHNIEEMVKYE